MQPLGRTRRPRLHPPRQHRVQCRYRQAHPHQIALRHRHQNIQIPQDQIGLGHNRYRMVEPVQHRQHRAGQLQRPVYRLIRVGIGAQRNRPRHIAGLAQLPLQNLRHIRLEAQLGFKIQAGGVAKIGVARPGIAINAAMLAATIRVHRPVKAQIRAAVPTDHTAGRIARQRGLQRRRLHLHRVPAIIKARRHLRVEAAGRVDRRPPPLTRRRRHYPHRRRRLWNAQTLPRPPDAWLAIWGRGAVAHLRLQHPGALNGFQLLRVNLPRQVEALSQSQMMSQITHRHVPSMFSHTLPSQGKAVKNKERTNY